MSNFNKENMLRWAEALESGKYKQCHGTWGQETYDDGEIINEGKFCCLNVALMEFTGKDYGNHNFDDGYEVFKKYLNPIWTAIEHTYKFVDMNDDQGLTFPEIAQEIRKMVE